MKEYIGPFRYVCIMGVTFVSALVLSVALHINDINTSSLFLGAISWAVLIALGEIYYKIDKLSEGGENGQEG